VDFFSKVSNAMAGSGPVAASEGGRYALDSFEAVAPLLFALKDWSLGKFDDAGKLLALYLSATPGAAFQWVAEFKPLAQKYADEEAAYEKAAAAAATADTPDKRADALKQVHDLKARTKGKLAGQLGKLEQELKKKSTDLDAAFNQRVATEKQRDQDLLAEAKRKYASLCADFRFDEARAAVEGLAVSGPEAVREKEALIKKAGWLHQFKAQLIQDINVYGYTNVLVNRSGGRLPDGQKKATDDGVIVQTPFGAVPSLWNTLPPGALLAMANSFSQRFATTAPDQAAERQWLSGVFACEEGMSRDGRTLLVQASQVKDEYKEQLSLFLESE
jgi:hypothetical protein